MFILSRSMEDLPVHVIADILSRLPVKTIIHCKCVCKKWLELLSDSYFANLHLSRSPASLMIHHSSENEPTGYPTPGILKWMEVEDELHHHHLHQDPIMSLDLNLAPIFQKSQILPIGSVNGLLCLWQFHPRTDNTYICNPITREYMILPRQQYYKKCRVVIDHGFGVGSVTQEYKVIRIFQEDIPPDCTSISRSGLSEAEVYTLGTGQWRSLGHVPYRINGSYGPFLNGHAHWTVSDEDFPEKIYVFDFDKEAFKLFPSPPIKTMEESQINYRSLAVLKGCLCESDTYDSHLTIWVMKEYGIKKTWHKEVIIKESIPPDLDWLLWEPAYLLEGLKDGTILIVYGKEKLLAYSPQTRTIKKTEYFDSCFTGAAYRPSFLKLQNFDLERVHVF